MADYQLQVTPVLGRDESPTRLLNLFTIGEFVLYVLSFVITQVMFHKAMLSLVALGIAICWTRYFQSRLPERFVSNFIRFHLRHHVIYRAGAPDTQWRPPILHDPRRSRA